MVKEAAELRAEIDRLSAKLASMEGQPAKREASEKTAGKMLLAEIDELEEQIAGMYAADEDDDETESVDTDVTAAGDDAEEAEGEVDTDVTADDDGDEAEEAEGEVDAEVTSSEEAPGIEDEITQDKFTEVERTRPSNPPTSGPSMRSVAPTNYTARLMQASARLDRVADYLEKNGRKQLAFRIDKIADAIDNHIKTAKEA